MSKIDCYSDHGVIIQSIVSPYNASKYILKVEIRLAPEKLPDFASKNEFAVFTRVYEMDIESKDVTVWISDIMHPDLDAIFQDEMWTFCLDHEASPDEMYIAPLRVSCEYDEIVEKDFYRV